MIRPIVKFNAPVLKEVCEPVENFEEVKPLAIDLWDTLYSAVLSGIAASQINQAKRVFIVDSRTAWEDIGWKGRQVLFPDGSEGIREVFINAEIIEYSEDEDILPESSESIPGFSVWVPRSKRIRVRYFNENGFQIEKDFAGYTARTIQHVYDHTEGILITDLGQTVLSSSMIFY